MPAKQKKTIGEKLKDARMAKNFSLRQVEEVTEISNAYLSQLEHNKIKKPSANVFYKLANLYGIDFNHLLREAGVIEEVEEESSLRRLQSNSSDAHHSIAGYSLSSKNLTPEEEEALIEYLKFMRFQKKK